VRIALALALAVLPACETGSTNDLGGGSGFCQPVDENLTIEIEGEETEFLAGRCRVDIDACIDLCRHAVRDLGYAVTSCTAEFRDNEALLFMQVIEAGCVLDAPIF
jgi:hypothetical protein